MSNKQYFIIFLVEYGIIQYRILSSFEKRWELGIFQLL